MSVYTSKTCHNVNREHPGKNMSTTQRTKMNSMKPTHTDVLKKPSAYLNPGMDPTPLIPKAARVRLSEEAVQNLRVVIRGQRKSEVESSAKVSTKQAINQPLVLASASAGILPGFAMGDCHFMQSSVNSAYVSILKPNKIGVIVREGVKENPHVGTCHLTFVR